MQTPRAVGESMPGVDIDVRPSPLADGTATASSGLDADMTHEMAKAVPKSTPSPPVKSSSEMTPAATTAKPIESNPVQSPAGHGRDRQSSEGVSQDVLSQTVLPDSPSIDPKVAAPLTADDAVALPAAEIPGFQAQDDPRQPKVVHLPPRDQQERHLREVEHALARRDRILNEKATLSLGSGLGDLASSPSSTVGPHSTTTPRPAHPSPDTSPDEESFPADVAASGRNGSLSVYEEEMTKDEEHRILKSQMDAARRRARAGSPAMSDSQLRLEDEQAIKTARDTAFAPNGAGVNDHGSTSQNALESAQGAGGDTFPPEVKPLTTALGVVSPNTPASVDKIWNDVSKDNRDAPLNVPDGDATTLEPSQPLATSAQRHQSASPGEIESGERKDIDMNQNRADGLQSGSGDFPLIQDSERTSAINSSGLSGDNAALGSVEDDSTQAVAQMFSELSHAGQRGIKRRRLSTVVFTKQDHTRILDELVRESEDYAALRGASQDPDRDYLEPLFSWQAHQSPRSRPLLDVLQTANKTVSTENQHAAAEAVHEYRTLKKIYQMQSASRWSFRQLERSQEPRRPPNVWDNLLGQMKAMRTDFREERKWKHAIARKMAHWCAEFVASGPRQRKLLQVKVRPNASFRRDRAGSNGAAGADALATSQSNMSGGLHDVPELIHSAANETESEWFPDDEGPGCASGTAQPPAALFSLDYDDVILCLEDNAATNSLISELPLYEPKPLPDIPPDDPNDSASSTAPALPIVPVSKLVTGKIVPTILGPPKKKSRYDYEEEDEVQGDRSTGQSFEDVWPSQGYHISRQEIPPENTDVALFNKENQTLRDRIHASHAFRPPAEFGMPPTTWFEAKTSSQWLWEEDQRLRTLVREYSYNWSIISDRLAIPSLFTSAAERRTPWECFERWYLLEGLPADMLKTAYFRTYQSRLETAARSIAAQWQASQQQQAQTPGQGTPVRRRSSQPCRVERRRNNRYLALIDAMRKLARKRESIQHKQQEGKFEHPGLIVTLQYGSC